VNGALRATPPATLSPLGVGGLRIACYERPPARSVTVLRWPVTA